jgi:DNA repair exonuclease SbcCD nuclease subunit
VKSYGGNLPAYGVLRKCNAWAAGAIPEEFWDVFIGHLHQPMVLQMAHGGLVRMSPSTESGSAYAREFAGAHGRPGQRLVFVNPEKGRVTADYLLDLE